MEKKIFRDGLVKAGGRGDTKVDDTSSICTISLVRVSNGQKKLTGSRDDSRNLNAKEMIRVKC